MVIPQQQAKQTHEAQQSTKSLQEKEQMGNAACTPLRMIPAAGPPLPVACLVASTPAAHGPIRSLDRKAKPCGAQP
jgi:hypothetical protein